VTSSVRSFHLPSNSAPSLASVEEKRTHRFQ
jgi:hypothetical protein